MAKSMKDEGMGKAFHLALMGCPDRGGEGGARGQCEARTDWTAEAGPEGKEGDAGAGRHGPAG